MIARSALFAVLPLLLAATALADDPGGAELHKCKICHSLEEGGGNRVGPNLHGVFGRTAGTAPGFNFSAAMKASGIVWDEESLAKFLRNPKDSLPGNRMSFPGIEDDTARHDLVRRLRSATQ